MRDAMKLLLTWLFGQHCPGHAVEERRLQRRLVRVERRVQQDREFPLVDYVRRERS